MQREAASPRAFTRRNTLPATSESDRLATSHPESPGILQRAARESDPGHGGLAGSARRVASSQLPPRDAAAAVRALQAAPHFAGAPVGTVPAQATLGSLASMLMACSILQVGARRYHSGRSLALHHFLQPTRCLLSSAKRNCVVNFVIGTIHACRSRSAACTCRVRCLQIRRAAKCTDER